MHVLALSLHYHCHDQWLTNDHLHFCYSAFLICDRIGRLNATRVLCIIWAVGIAIFMAGGVKGNLGAIYAGRFIAGLGVGQTPVVG
jgi:hypothetical protein